MDLILARYLKTELLIKRKRVVIRTIHVQRERYASSGGIALKASNQFGCDPFLPKRPRNRDIDQYERRIGRIDDHSAGRLPGTRDYAVYGLWVL